MVEQLQAWIVEKYGPGDQCGFFGRCNICDQRTVFVHVPERSTRESFVCAGCSSSARYRGIARGVLHALRRLTGREVRALADLPAHSLVGLRLLDTQPTFSYPPFAAYEIPKIMAERGCLVDTTLFKPEQPWGSPLGLDCTNQNLECLTFPDAQFDLVITSDVMEHVRLYERAHSEIHRVLKPGGFYVFSVPHTRAQAAHVVRVRVNDPEEPSGDEHLLPDEFHGSPDADEQSGVLSYRAFGTDLDSELNALGFDVEYLNEPDPAIGVLNSEAFVCRRG